MATLEELAALLEAQQLTKTYYEEYLLLLKKFRDAKTENAKLVLLEPMKNAVNKWKAQMAIQNEMEMRYYKK